MKEYIRGYFSNLFMSEVSQPNREVLSLVTRKVTIEMNNALMAPYTVEEVRKALLDIGDLKAPAPDRLHNFFIRGFGLCWKKI